MKRTVTALYETRAQADQVKAALVAANLGDDVDIRDESDKAESGSKHHDLGTWLHGLLGGHDDRHVYIEGVRRGHCMLSAKVDELNETRAAEILDASAPVDLERAQNTWRAEGWAPGDTAGGPISTAAPGKDLNSRAPMSPSTGKHAGVRVYSTGENAVAP